MPDSHDTPQRQWSVEDIIDGLRTIAARRGAMISLGDVLVAEAAMRKLLMVSEKTATDERPMSVAALSQLFGRIQADYEELSARSAIAAIPWTPEETAKRFHEAYEHFAPMFGWRTQEVSRVPWGQLPQNQRDLMIAVVRNVLIEQTL